MASEKRYVVENSEGIFALIDTVLDEQIGCAEDNPVNLFITADLLNAQADEIASAREAQQVLGAEASAMREALIEIADFWSDTDKYPDAYEGLPSKATMALESTTAGADLLAELERLRAIADKFIVLMQAGSRPEKDMWKLLDAAKAARGGEG